MWKNRGANGFLMCRQVILNWPRSHSCQNVLSKSDFFSTQKYVTAFVYFFRLFTIKIFSFKKGAIVLMNLVPRLKRVPTLLFYVYFFVFSSNVKKFLAQCNFLSIYSWFFKITISRNWFFNLIFCLFQIWFLLPV